MAASNAASSTSHQQYTVDELWLKILWSSLKHIHPSYLGELVEFQSVGKQVLNNFVKNHSWVEEFINKEQSDFILAQADFNKDGSRFLKALQKFTDLYRKNVTVEVLSRDRTNVYWAILCTKIGELQNSKAENQLHLSSEVGRFSTNVRGTQIERPSVEDHISQSQVQWQEFKKYIASEKLSNNTLATQVLTEYIEQLEIPPASQPDTLQLSRLPNLDQIELLEAIYRTEKICSSSPLHFCGKPQDLSILEDVLLKFPPHIDGPGITELNLTLSGVGQALSTIFHTMTIPFVNHTKHETFGPDFIVPKLWRIFLSNIRNFIISVGGQNRAHEESQLEANFAELENISISRMQFVASMQKTIREQSEQIAKQRKVITALKFRHLLEHLPGEEYDDSDSATDKWTEFWKDAMREFGMIGTLEARENEKEKDLGDILRVEFRDSSLETSTSPDEEDESESLSDGNEEEMIPALEGIAKNSRLKRMAFERGLYLYGELSTVIHDYQSGEFDVDVNNWGPVTRAVLNALKPKYINDGEVNWKKERKRYPLKQRY